MDDELEHRLQVNAVEHAVLRMPPDLNRLASNLGGAAAVESWLEAPAPAMMPELVPPHPPQGAAGRVQDELIRRRYYDEPLLPGWLMRDLEQDHQQYCKDLRDDKPDIHKTVENWAAVLLVAAKAKGPVEAAWQEEAGARRLEEMKARGAALEREIDAKEKPDPLAVERDQLRIECLAKDAQVAALLRPPRRNVVRGVLIAAIVFIVLVVGMAAFWPGELLAILGVPAALSVVLGKVLVGRRETSEGTAAAIEALTGEPREKLIRLFDRLGDRESALRDGRIAGDVLAAWEARPETARLRESRPSALLRRLANERQVYQARNGDAPNGEARNGDAPNGEARQDSSGGDDLAKTRMVEYGAYLTELDPGESWLLGLELARLLFDRRRPNREEYCRCVRVELATACRATAGRASGDDVLSALKSVALQEMGGVFSLVEVVQGMLDDEEARAALTGRITMLGAAAASVFHHAQSARTDPGCRRGTLEVGYPLVPPPTGFVQLVSAAISPRPVFTMSAGPDQVDFLFAGINLATRHSREDELGAQAIAKMEDADQVDRLWRYPRGLRRATPAPARNGKRKERGK